MNKLSHNVRLISFTQPIAKFLENIIKKKKHIKATSRYQLNLNSSLKNTLPLKKYLHTRILASDTPPFSEFSPANCPEDLSANIKPPNYQTHQNRH